MVFGRSLTEARLISSANYVRTELPTRYETSMDHSQLSCIAMLLMLTMLPHRLAHRIRDMQQLPYVVVTNPHISEVYDLYYTAFDTFRKVKEIKNLDDNERFCKTISQTLKAHLSVIPKLAMGILESSGLMPAEELDQFMNTILRSVCQIADPPPSFDVDIHSVSHAESSRNSISP